MSASDLFLGAANIFVGGNAPASGAAVGVNATTGIPTTGGTSVGLTDGPATFRIGGNIKEIMAEQALSVVKVRKTSEEVEVEFTVKEIDFARLQKYMVGSSITVNVAGTPDTKTVTGGGVACVDTNLVTLTAKQPCADASGNYFYIIICLYQAYMADVFEIPFGKESESMVKVKMRALADTTRAVGDQTYQVVQQF